MTISENIQATSQEQPSLKIKPLDCEQSRTLMHQVTKLISENLFSEGSLASLLQDSLITDCLFLLPSGNQVRIMVTTNN